MNSTLANKRNSPMKRDNLKPSSHSVFGKHSQGSQHEAFSKNESHGFQQVPNRLNQTTAPTAGLISSLEERNKAYKQ